MPGSQAIKRVAAFVAFAVLGFIVFLYPQAALVPVSLILAAFAFTRPSILKLGIVGLVLVPTVGFLRSSEAVTNAMQLAQSIESGSMLNRVAGTLLLATGIICLFWGRHRIGRVNLTPWVGAFILFAFLSFFWSQGPMQTLRRAAEALFVALFALGVGAVYYDRKPEGSTELIRTMCWASSLLSFAVLALSVARGDFHIANPAWRLGRIGIENQIGWCASVGFLAAWTTRARKDIWTRKEYLWFNLMIPGLVVLLTKSRETWLGVLAALFFLEFLKPRPLKKKLYGAMAVISVVVLFTQVPALKQMWNRGETDEDMQTASGRTQIWQQAIPMIRSHLMLGHGYGAFWIGQTVLTFSADWSPTSLHNGYLDSTAEAGLIGLLLIGIGVWVSSRNAWRLMKYPGQSEIALVLLVLTVNFMVINLFGAVLEVFNYFPVTALLVYSFFVSHRLDTFTRKQKQDSLTMRARASGFDERPDEFAWAASSHLQREPYPNA
jgi:exopolysaccharide production protein ExoQ